MGTALVYLLVMIGVAAVVFVAAALIFGRGEEMAPLPPGHTPTRLPFGEVAGDDVRAVRFQQVLRGYRMSEVDWVLERLAAELDESEDERAELRSRVDELERPLRSQVEKRVDQPVDKQVDQPVDEPRKPSPVPRVAEAEPSKVDQPQRPSPAPRKMLSRETEDAGER